MKFFVRLLFFFFLFLFRRTIRRAEWIADRCFDDVDTGSGSILPSGPFLFFFFYPTLCDSHLACPDPRLLVFVLRSALAAIVALFRQQWTERASVYIRKIVEQRAVVHLTTPAVNSSGHAGSLLASLTRPKTSTSSVLPSSRLHRPRRSTIVYTASHTPQYRRTVRTTAWHILRYIHLPSRFDARSSTSGFITLACSSPPQRSVEGFLLLIYTAF